MERNASRAADDARDAILHQGFAEVEPVPKFHSGLGTGG